MQRRHFLATLAPLLAAPLVARTDRVRHLLDMDDPMKPNTLHDAAGLDARQPVAKLDRPHAEWKRELTREQYDVLFEEHTERPGSSPLNAEKREGTFVCAACHLPLFAAAAKYESGTGWPSFHTPLPGRVATKRDWRLILPRTEYHCARCGGHQGHVFDDGPKPTGKRYCNNGVALQFVAAGTPLPPLRG
jgi:peptide-methionine (R)-S-oxide reductase